MDRRRAAGALLALAACIACSAAAPTASNHTALDIYEGAKDGCYYNFQHYGEGDRIMTNEPCLNCTCHNRMLMCYLRVCPFTKAIGQDCTVEKRADQCCPIVTCPDVPVDLLTSTSTSSPAEYGATGLGKQDKYGCSINGRYFPEGSKVPPTPNKPCEHCYCIRNMTTCVMQECTLHVDGCTPIYHKDVCCPVRYSCDHPEDEVPLLDDMSTTVRPTPGFLLTTTTLSPVTQMSQDCVHNNRMISDGASIRTEKACEHCYCMKGDIVCVVQECGAPMENEGKNCTSLPPREGQCCPDTYICEGDEPGSDLATDAPIDTLIEELTTLSPPRRTGVEGSGYRNEDEIVHTDMPIVEPELEGSGEEQEPTQDTREPMIPSKPLETEEFTHSFEDGDQYIPVTTKAPISISDIMEITSDNIENETVEPQITMLTTQLPAKEGFDEDIKVPKVEKEEPSEHGTTSSIDIQTFEKGTTEPSEFLNTVPDAAAEQEHDKSHAPTTLRPSSEEIDTAVAKETEKPYDIPESVTVIETAGPEIHIDATPATDEIRTPAPQLEEDTTTDKIIAGKDNELVEEYTTSTSSIPVADKVEKLNTELDHASNTVGIIEEGTIYTSIPKIDVTEKTTSPLVTDSDNDMDIHENVSSPSPTVTEEEKTTAEPDKGLNTIPSETNEGTTQSSLLDTRSTETTIIVDATEHLESDTKMPTVSEISTSLPDTHVTKTDQHTVTTEPSFRREDESSASTEKPRDESERTTVKSDLTDEGLIPTSVLDKESETDSSMPSIDEFITTGTPDYLDTDKEPEDAVASVKPVTESVPVTTFVSDSATEKFTESTSSYEQGKPSTTEKTVDITAVTAEYDSHDEPSRIPGEGDCLLNAVTYRNNTIVPSINKCHISCMCVSSIIKCEPVVCSPLPENMHNCQSIYDTPDSCCPSYICDSRETVPPKSDSQMSGTEPPVLPPKIECRGDQCELSESTKEPLKPVGPEPCKEENGCQSEEILPSNCIGDEPCRRKDTQIDQKLPPKCEGTQCIHQVDITPTEISITDQTPKEDIPIKDILNEKEPLEPLDSPVTKHSEIVTDHVYTSTEHSLAVTTDGDILPDKITEKVDVDIATEEFILAETEGTKKPDHFEQDGIVKPVKEEAVSPTLETKGDDIKQPIEEVREGETHKPDITPEEMTEKITTTKDTVTYIPDTADQGYTDEPIIADTQGTKKPYEHPDQPVKEEDAMKPEDLLDKYTSKPLLTDTEDIMISTITEGKTTILLEETSTKMPDITEEDTKVPDKEHGDKPPKMDSQDSTVSEPINEISTKQPDLASEEVTTITDDIREYLTSKPDFTLDEDTKAPQTVKGTSETPSNIDKETTSTLDVFLDQQTDTPVLDTEKGTKRPDTFIKDKTDVTTSPEDSLTTAPDMRDDKYTEKMPTYDRTTIISDIIDDAHTDIPSSFEEQTIHTNILDATDKEQSYKPDTVQTKGTTVPDLVKEHTDKTISVEESSTKVPDIIDAHTDKLEVTIEEHTQLPDKILEKQTNSPTLTEEEMPDISEAVTDKGVMSGDKFKDKPIFIDEARPDEPTVMKEGTSEKTDLYKEEGITQSIISEENTEMPDINENIVTKKPVLIDENTESPIEIEDTIVTKIPGVIEEGITDKNVSTAANVERPSLTEEDTNIYFPKEDKDKEMSVKKPAEEIPILDDNVKAKPSLTEEDTNIYFPEEDKDYDKTQQMPAGDTSVPETLTSTQASTSTEHKLPSIPEKIGSGVEEPIASVEEQNLSSEGKETDRPMYVTPATITEVVQTEIYTEPISEHLPGVDREATNKDKMHTQEDTNATPEYFVTQTSTAYVDTSVPVQEIKTSEPEIYTPEKEEMITSHIDSPVTEPFKGFTEIEDTFVTGPEETTGQSIEPSEHVKPFATEEQSPDKDRVTVSTAAPISDEKVTKTPQESYTESYQGYTETPIKSDVEPSKIAHKPEISTLLPASAEPPRSTAVTDSENNVSDSSESTFTDLPIPIVTVAEDKPTVSVEVTDTQEDKGTQMPDFSIPSELVTPTSSPEMYVTRVETPTAKPESHVTGLVEKSHEPQKPVAVDIQVTTEISPSPVDDQPGINVVEDSATGNEDKQQIPQETYTMSTEKSSDRPYIDHEVNKQTVQNNVAGDQTTIQIDVSETTPYLIELEEHTHKTVEDIPNIPTSEQDQDQTTEISSPAVYNVEDAFTISPATEKHEEEKAPDFGSIIEVVTGKESSTTEKPDSLLDTDRIPVTVNEIIQIATTEIPIKEEEIMIPEKESKPVKESIGETEGTPTTPIDKDYNRDEKPVFGTDETVPPISTDKSDKPIELPGTETEVTMPTISKDKYGKPDEITMTSSEETMSTVTVTGDKYGKPDDVTTSDVGTTESTISENMYGSLEDKDKKHDQKPILDIKETLSPVSEDKPKDQINSEIGDVTISQTEDNKDKEKPISGTGVTVPFVSEDKYTKPDFTLSSDMEVTTLPDYVDKDSMPVGKPDESEGTARPDTDDKHDISDEKLGGQVVDIEPPISEGKDSTPDAKGTEPSEISSETSDDKYGKPEVSTETEEPFSSVTKETESKPYETPDTSEKTTRKPDDIISTETESTIPVVSEGAVSKPDRRPINENEDTTPTHSEDKYDMPDDKITTESSDFLSSLSKDKDDKPEKVHISEVENNEPPATDKYATPDSTSSSVTETVIPPYSEDKESKPDSIPISGTGEIMPPVSGDNKPFHEAGEIIPPPSDNKDIKVDEKPISSSAEMIPTITKDKEPISENGENIPPVLDKTDRKPGEKPDSGDSEEKDKAEKPLKEIEEIVRPVSGDKDSQSQEGIGAGEHVPTISEDIDSKPDVKPITKPDIIPQIVDDKDKQTEKETAGESGEIASPVSKDKDSKPDEQPVTEPGEIVTPISEDKDMERDKKPTTGSGETVLPVSEDKYIKPDEKPFIEPGETIPPVSEDLKGKPVDEKPISESGETVPSVPEDQESKPYEKPVSESGETVPPISEDKDIQPDKKPVSGSGETIQPIFEDKDSEPDEKPISKPGESVPTVSKDEDTKPYEKPINESEEKLPPVTEDKNIQSEKKPVGESGESVPPSEDKDTRPDEKPTSGPSESLSTVPLEKPISDTEEISKPVTEDKFTKPDDALSSETDRPISEDKDSKPEEKPISESEESVPSVSDDKESQPEEKPIMGSEEIKTPVSEKKPTSEPIESVLPDVINKDSKPEDKPISEIGETIPPVSDKKDSTPEDKPSNAIQDSKSPISEDKDQKPLEKPVTETVSPVTEDKGSKPDEKPISGYEENVPPVSKDEDSKPQEKPIGVPEESIATVSEDKDTKVKEKPISKPGETVPTDSENEDSKLDDKPKPEETVPTVSEDKDTKHDEEPFIGPGETMSPATGDKDIQPDEKPVSGLGETVPTIPEDKYTKPEEKPISGPGETASPVSGDKDTKPDEKPISGLGDTVPQVPEDEESKLSEKPISGLGETVPQVPEDEESKPSEKPISGAGEKVPPVSDDDNIKPDEISTSQTTETTPPVKDDNYGKPDGHTSEVSLPPSTTPEIPKPFVEPHPTDEVPMQEEDGSFPPSGTGYGEPDYVEEDQAFGPGTCRYGGKVYVSAQQIPRDDPCDFCFCFRSDIICLQQSCPPPIHGCHEEPIQGFCCPRYECPVSMATTVNVTTTTTTTTTTLPPHFPTHPYKGAAQRRGCQIKGHTYKVGDVVRSSSGPCLHCTCGGDGQMKCDPKACTPEPMLRQMIMAAMPAKHRR